MQLLIPKNILHKIRYVASFYIRMSTNICILSYCPLTSGAAIHIAH